MKSNLPKILVALGRTCSMAEGRRLVIGGNVSVNGNKITNISEEVLVNTGDIVKVGKTEIVVSETINGDTNDSCNASSDSNSETR